MTSYSATEQRRLTILGSIIELVDSGKSQVIPKHLLMQSDDQAEWQSLSADVRALADDGFLDVEERIAGMWMARPMQLGRETWGEFATFRDNSLARRKQLRNDYLVWIYQEADRGHAATPESFASSNIGFFGAVFTFDEVDQAGAWLKDRGFLTGQGAWQLKGPMRPRLTVKGTDYVENETDVHDDPQLTAGASYYFNGPAQVAHGSRDVRMVQNNADLQDVVRDIAASLQQLASLMDGEDREVLTSAAVELLEEAETVARPERIKALVEGTLRVLGSGAGGALGAVVSGQLTALLSTLPV